ncbi:phage holin family protein [Paracoccus benzoatiresistens]|uniref:Phage holin family protein n=1 Tax=Paracoccus benzoatiresistens TaxID=2997341 RepID=A0ABT4J5R2_9RHOB|nr:phage holin family protein [Paracoccus sp. EF6]MCZ0962244.1 phage holin family protein [Paracoccus sp. EF6]
MFDYAQRLQLALKDTARRSAMKAAAGVILVVAAGFLIAAFWSFLAHNLGWGPALASLVVGGIFVLAAVVLWLVSKKPKHEMPTKEDLRKEVEARVTLAKDAAIERARAEAERVVDIAGNKVASLMDDATYRANKLADDTERRVYGVARHAAESVGLTSTNIETVRSRYESATDTLSRANSSNAASIAKILGAFAVGMTLAAKLREGRDPDEYQDDIL